MEGMERVGFVACMIGALLERGAWCYVRIQPVEYVSIAVRISLTCSEYSLKVEGLYSLWKGRARRGLPGT